MREEDEEEEDDRQPKGEEGKGVGGATEQQREGPSFTMTFWGDGKKRRGRHALFSFSLYVYTQQLLLPTTPPNSIPVAPNFILHSFFARALIDYSSS